MAAVDPAQRGTEEPWARIRSRIWARDRGVCQVCGERVPDRYYECGHVVDRCCGGSDRDDNLVVMCVACNRGKPPHETRAAYDAWIAAGGWPAERATLLAAAVMPIWEAASEDERARLLAASAAMARWAAAHRARVEAEEAHARAVDHRRRVGRPPGSSPRRQHQQAVLEALWKAGRRGLPVQRLMRLPGVTFATVERLAARGEIVLWRSLSWELAVPRCYAAVPAPPPLPALPADPGEDLVDGLFGALPAAD